MLLITPDSQSYSEKQITCMLAKAGVKKIRRLSFQGPTDSGIITGMIRKICVYPVSQAASACIFNQA